MAGFWKVVGLVALVAGVVLFFGYNPGPRQYSGGHEVAHTFEVFSHENPFRELLGIFLFMILPVAVATGLRLGASYLAARIQGRPFQFRPLLPVAMMCGVVTALLTFIVATVIFKPHGSFSVQRALFDLETATVILGLPALLFVTPVLMIARYQKFRGREQAMPSGFIYATIFAAFVAQYFWWSAFNQA